MRCESGQQYEDDTISSQKHLADESILIHGLSCSSLLFCPHLFNILEHHIAVAIKCFDSSEKLVIIAT